MTSDKEKKPRGRPRPPETVERDNRILAYLKAEGPKTRNEIMEHFGLASMVTWLSLDRLRKQGLVRTCTPPGKESAAPGVTLRWSADADKPCP